MDIASTSRSLANGVIPDQWSTVAAMRKGDISAGDLASLTDGLDAFVGRLLCQLWSLRDRLINAGFTFHIPDYSLRAATDEDVAALHAFIKKYGSALLSVRLKPCDSRLVPCAPPPGTSRMSDHRNPRPLVWRGSKLIATKRVFARAAGRLFLGDWCGRVGLESDVGLTLRASGTQEISDCRSAR